MMICMQGDSSTLSAPQARVLSIDVLRGITIAFMILVNDPGDWTHTYSQLEHSVWNGCTLTDLVFPTFLFLVGASTIFSLRSRLARGDSRVSLALHIVRRSATLFAIDLFIAAFPYFHLTQLRLYGVLTRIALCYLCVGLICLVTQRASRLLAICVAILVSYWALMRLVPVPGFGTPTHDIPLLDPDRNLVAWIDRGVTAFLQRTIHTGVLYEHTRDPEGLLSTLPSVATTLIGSLAALWIRRADAKDGGINRPQCARGLLFSGFLSLSLGLIWNFWFPINKKLWTSSYALFAAGCALMGLALCYWAIDIRRLHETRIGRVLTWPWLVFGSNAIVVYAFAELLVEVLSSIKVNDDGKTVTAWYWGYFHIFARNGSTNFTSLLAAVAYVGFCFLPNWLLWRKRIFVKI
jgi:predicted acyltransferase